ncbi:arginase family protein [Inquilinus sp. CA228]|uniref:arginase family protein n=1 Tax=Inquilinus sp. CA228 TaxID=3455609 RepID=UPI003F8D6501
MGYPIEGIAGTTLIRAPSNLGLRPLRPGHEPGTWRGPQVLTEAGLAARLALARIVDLARPRYSTEPQPGTVLRNGPAIRRFNEQVADAVDAALRDRLFPIVVGGDCSILIGALAGARRHSELALVHLDGHSDFRHPGNYEDFPLHSAAGMDLALAVGLGDPLMLRWDGAPDPLVPAERAIQIGEREGRDPDWGWEDIADTAITRIDMFELLEIGLPEGLRRSFAVLDRTPEIPFWVHLDVDILDQAVMPAVDSPGSPGLDYDGLAQLLRGFLASPRCLGLNVTIYDPDLDPEGEYARGLIEMLVEGLAPLAERRQG